MKSVRVATSVLTRSDLLRLGLVVEPVSAELPQLATSPDRNALSAPPKRPAGLLGQPAQRTPCAECGSRTWKRSRIHRGRLLCEACAAEARR